MSPNPIDDEELYLGLVLGGMRSPGALTLTGHDDPVAWDVKSGNGQSGATITLKELPLRTFKATFYLADAEDFEAWEAYRDLINSTVNGKAPKALDVYHPDLATQGIKSVVKGKIYGTVHDRKGGQTIAVDFQEYRAPKPKGGSPNGSATSRIKPKIDAPDPNQAALDELSRLTNTYQNTPWS